MRLLFVTGSLVHGGAERHAIVLMNRLAERGHQCHAAYVKDDTSQLGRIRLPPDSTVRSLRAARYLDRGALARLATLIEALSPSAVLAANCYALMYASLAMRRARSRAPLAVAFHSYRVRGVRTRLQMLAYTPLFWRADCAMFVCHAQRRRWRRRLLLARRNEVIHNGVDVAHFRDRWSDAEREALRARLGARAGELVVGLAAVLRPEKNPLQLVDAVALLRRRGVPARALMIGDGELRGAVEARAREAGIAEWVSITGLREDVRPLMAACDAVALTSFTEALSLAAIEAMALARPVVHPAVGGGAELVQPGRTGFLFPVGDTEALAGRLAALADPEVRTRTGEGVRERAAALFSEAAMVDRYEAVLEQLATRSEDGQLRRTAGAH